MMSFPETQMTSGSLENIIGTKFSFSRPVTARRQPKDFHHDTEKQSQTD